MENLNKHNIQMVAQRARMVYCVVWWAWTYCVSCFMTFSFTRCRPSLTPVGDWCVRQPPSKTSNEAVSFRNTVNCTRHDESLLKLFWRFMMAWHLIISSYFELIFLDGGGLNQQLSDCSLTYHTSYVCNHFLNKWGVVTFTKRWCDVKY